MTFSKINHLAVWVAIILQFVIGFLWYGPLFGESWMKMVGLSYELIDANPPGAGEWITNIISAVAGVYLLAFLFVKMDIASFSQGALYGFLISFVFVLLSEKTSGAFAHYPYGLPWITGGFTTVGLTVAGAILGAWVKKEK